jgi:hypothetical protein
MKTRNHIIGTAIRNKKFRTGKGGTRINHNAVKTAAKTPLTTVARLLPKYPMFFFKNFLEYNS